MPDLEAPEPDAAEQEQPVSGGVEATPDGSRPIDANEADVQEQRQEAPLEEDDYDR